MSLTGQLVRCPKCIAPIPGAVGPDGTITLDPSENRCPKCGHIFTAAQALFEDYVGHGNYGRNRRLTRFGAVNPQRQSYQPHHRQGISPAPPPTTGRLF